MSQIFDYFVCSRSLIDQWAKALASGDKAQQAKIEAKMPKFLTLRNLGQDEFNILAWCVQGGKGDVVEAVGAVDLVTAISEDEGPWLMAFQQPAIQAIAGMSVDESLLNR